MKDFFYDDAETISRWRYVAGFAAAVVLWGIVMTLASGILT